MAARRFVGEDDRLRQRGERGERGGDWVGVPREEEPGERGKPRTRATGREIGDMVWGVASAVVAWTLRAKRTEKR